MMTSAMSRIEALATFELRSGHLCYGELHNIYNGASAEKVQALPVLSEPVPGGTIRRHETNFNLPALHGMWHIYPLVGKYGNDEQTVAFFVSHSSVDPLAETDKILRVSGSPYEHDSGSTFNDEDTAREGVFVVNRYDWGWVDERGREDVKEAEMPIDLPYHFSAVGIVDYDAAKDFVERLRVHRADQREMAGEDSRGAWLGIKNAEYQFGRFGFDEEKKHARSFLFFSSYTDFTATRFEGDGQQTLRKLETPAERFQRRLMEGYDFSQRRHVEKIFPDLKPADFELLGPYAAEEYILSEPDVRAVRDHMDRDSPEFGPRPRMDIENTDIAVKEALEMWWSASVELVNEIFLSFLEYRIVPYLRDHPYESPEIASRTLFPTDPPPGSEDRYILAEYLHDRFLGSENNASSSNTGSDPEHASVKARMREFLLARGLHPDSDFLERICRVLAYILKELMEQALNASRDNERFGHIVPSDVLLAIINDEMYKPICFRSKAMWVMR